jgi:hypothetical protein
MHDTDRCLMDRFVEDIINALKGGDTNGISDASATTTSTAGVVIDDNIITQLVALGMCSLSCFLSFYPC